MVYASILDILLAQVPKPRRVALIVSKVIEGTNPTDKLTYGLDLRARIEGFDSKLVDALKRSLKSPKPGRPATPPLIRASDDVVVFQWDGEEVTDSAGRAADLRGFSTIIMYSHADLGGNLTPAGSLGDGPAYSPKETTDQLKAAGAAPSSFLLIGCLAKESGALDGFSASFGKGVGVGGAAGASKLGYTMEKKGDGPTNSSTLEVKMDLSGARP